MKDYYKILGLTKEASKDEIKKAFRSLAKKYHPDKNKDDESAIKMFQDVSEAYEVLGNEKSREEYDKKLETMNSKQANGTRPNGFNMNKNTSKKQTTTSKDKFENLNSYFEGFFGFKAGTNEVNKDKLNRNKNPMDTTDMFESFFRKK